MLKKPKILVVGSFMMNLIASTPKAPASGEAEKVYLGLTPGLPTVTDVLEAMMSVCSFEKMEVMQPEDGSRPEIFSEFEKLLLQCAFDRWLRVKTELLQIPPSAPRAAVSAHGGYCPGLVAPSADTEIRLFPELVTFALQRDAPGLYIGNIRMNFSTLRGRKSGGTVHIFRRHQAETTIGENK